MVANLLVESVQVSSLHAARQHRTELFECVHEDPPTAVLRRGQPFPVAIAFSNRPYYQHRDVVTLTFSFGGEPKLARRTLVQLVVSPSGVRSRGRPGAVGWGVSMQTDTSASSNAPAEPLLLLQVEAAADCPVGKWTLDVETRLQGDDKKRVGRYSHPQGVYILFNPWSKKDQVYMEDERLLDEYVLNDVGKVWKGTWTSLYSRQWVFGQFDSCVLPAALLALSHSTLRDSRRGDPVHVARAISQVVNCHNDNGGILWGEWENYEGGTPPTAWTGSVAILQQYLDTGVEVKYGQCWVFAAVATTVCRALGIPARVVSNLSSGHDADESLTIDRFFDAEDRELNWNPISDISSGDSIWNFHVWTDVWMARPDLPKGFGGWQAIDATPQEKSDGYFQCGPASLEAIRCGDVSFSHDVRFILASVNADVLHWKEDPNSELGYKRIRCEKKHIGRMIATKAPWIFDPCGENDQEDITDQYKYKEGSEEERLALMKAVSAVELARRYYKLPEEPLQDVDFSLVDLDKVTIGNDFSVSIMIQNRASEPRRVRALLTASSVYYTGVKAGLIKEASGQFTVPPGAETSLVMRVAADEYLGKLVEFYQVRIAAIATVLDTDDTWAGQDDFELTRPPLVIKVEDDKVTVGSAVAIAFSLKNPLRRRMTDCKLRFESPGLVKATTVECSDVEPDEELMLRKYFTPTKTGEHKLVGTFTSKELVGITGAVVFDVFDSEE